MIYISSRCGGLLFFRYREKNIRSPKKYLDRVLLSPMHNLTPLHLPTPRVARRRARIDRYGYLVCRAKSSRYHRRLRPSEELAKKSNTARHRRAATNNYFRDDHGEDSASSLPQTSSGCFARAMSSRTRRAYRIARRDFRIGTCGPVVSGTALGQSGPRKRDSRLHSRASLKLPAYFLLRSVVTQVSWRVPCFARIGKNYALKFYFRETTFNVIYIYIYIYMYMHIYTYIRI